MRITVQTLEVLRVLVEDPATGRYGLEISEKSGLSTGTVYPVLTRLEQAGWVRSTWEDLDESAAGRRARCYYRLTSDGTENAQSAIADVQHRLRPATEGTTAADPGNAPARERMALSSFESFYRDNYPRLVRYLKSQINTAWADEIAGDAMIAAWDKWDDLVTFERPTAWLFQVATHKARRLEARARKMSALDEDRASPETDLGVAAAHDDWIANHLDLIAAMRSLPRRQCEVIGLHYLGGYTVAETASILELTAGTVKNHLNRGLETLRQHQGASAALRLVIGSLA
ncbi:MAG TPA: sigma-70 family RNA polymerase sigma factor [Streptosporangiaceae bacterium]|nr:sigma-70 family RNA polymerase sigma factor [Streptosporangiaceae bacterium]